jgi:hypothetical protein
MHIIEAANFPATAPGDLSKRISTHLFTVPYACLDVDILYLFQFMHLKALMIARLVTARQRSSTFQTPATDDRV